MKKSYKRQPFRIPKRCNHVALALRRRGGAGKHGPTPKAQRRLDKVQTALSFQLLQIGIDPLIVQTSDGIPEQQLRAILWTLFDGIVPCAPIENIVTSDIVRDPFVAWPLA